MRLCFTPFQKTQAVAWHKEYLEKGWPSQPLPKPLKTLVIATQVTIGYIGKKTLKRKSMTCQRNRVHWIKKECKVTKGEPQPQLHAQCRKILKPISQPEPKKSRSDIVFIAKKAWLRSSPTLWIQDAVNVVCWAAFPGWTSVSRFPNIQLNGTGQERIPQQWGSCWGSWRPPKLLKTLWMWICCANTKYS